MPQLNTFKNSESYYSILFHELIRSTGHEKRLNRKLNQRSNFGSIEYSKEELCAELGASYLRNICQIENKELLQNSSAYIQEWIKILKNDNKFIVSAASKAQKAVDYILTQQL